MKGKHSDVHLKTTRCRRLKESWKILARGGGSHPPRMVLQNDVHGCKYSDACTRKMELPWDSCSYAMGFKYFQAFLDCPGHDARNTMHTKPGVPSQPALLQAQTELLWYHLWQEAQTFERNPAKPLCPACVGPHVINLSRPSRLRSLDTSCLVHQSEAPAEAHL